MSPSRLLLLALTFLPCLVAAQYDYSSSSDHPYGLPNPAAPAAIKDFAPLIGKCDCTSTSRLPDGTWAAPVAMTWTFRYIMNGHAVQDETLKADGKHSGSIRQYDPEQKTWLVHYYATGSPAAPLPYWSGNKEATSLVFLRDQKAPNGAEGKFRLRFHEVSATGYKWVGEWVSLDESIVYPTWKIDCRRE